MQFVQQSQLISDILVWQSSLGLHQLIAQLTGDRMTDTPNEDMRKIEEAMLPHSTVHREDGLDYIRTSHAIAEATRMVEEAREAEAAIRWPYLDSAEKRAEAAEHDLKTSRERAKHMKDLLEAAERHQRCEKHKKSLLTVEPCGHCIQESVEMWAGEARKAHAEAATLQARVAELNSKLHPKLSIGDKPGSMPLPLFEKTRWSWLRMLNGENDDRDELIVALADAFHGQEERAKIAERERDIAYAHVNDVCDPDDEVTDEGITVTERAYRDAAKFQTKRAITAERERDDALSRADFQAKGYRNTLDKLAEARKLIEEAATWSGAYAQRDDDSQWITEARAWLAATRVW